MTVEQPACHDAEDHHDEGDNPNHAHMPHTDVLNLSARSWSQPVADPVVHKSTGEDRQNSQHDERDRHDCRRLVRVDVRAPTLSPQEGQHHEASHVVGGDSSADKGQHPEDRALIEGGLDDVVFGEVAGGTRDTDNGEVAAREGPEGHRHHLGQRTKVVHVRVVTGTVHHRAGPKEHVRLKETVGEQVENRQSRTSRSQTCSQHHVADLAHRRSGEDLLDVLLRRTDPGAEQQGNGADDRHCQRGCTRVGIDLVRTYHQVNTSGNHRRSVDQG